MIKIAILDDDKTALMISTATVEAFLKEKNAEFKLFSFSNPLNFLASAKEEKFDLSFLDIDMPEMNGLDATRIIKEVDSRTPVIALSAYAFEENIRDAKNAGCDEFMAKPFKVENLIEMVGKYLD